MWAFAKMSLLFIGTVARDFPPPFFKNQKYPPWTLIRILSFSQIWFQISGAIRIEI
jgi:hypothetical protein